MSCPPMRKYSDVLVEVKKESPKQEEHQPPKRQLHKSGKRNFAKIQDPAAIKKRLSKPLISEMRNETQEAFNAAVSSLHETVEEVIKIMEQGLAARMAVLEQQEAAEPSQKTKAAKEKARGFWKVE